MRTRAPILSALVIIGAGCGGGPSAPPALGYGLPTVTRASYEVSDTLGVEINALGQTLELSVGSLATFGVEFADSPDGLRVTMRVEELAAQLNAPMAEPVTVDESVVDGDLVFSLDRRGRADVISTPDVGGAAGFFSATSIANTFFPRLPGRAVAAGDTWTDTVHVADGVDAGDGTQTTVLRYTVVGDVMVGGRSLLEIDVTGTSASDQTLDLQGTPVQQKTELELEGRVLWDMQRRLMVESETTSMGTGTVQVAVVPGQLPTRVEIHSTARLRE